MNYCSTNHLHEKTTLSKYYLPDTNANDKQRYRLIELKDQFSQLRNASNTIRNYLSSSNQQTSSSVNSPKHSSLIKINIDLLQFCIDLNRLLKLMECPICKHSQLNLRSALYLQLKHAISINQQENDRIIGCVRRFEGEFKRIL